MSRMIVLAAVLLLLFLVVYFLVRRGSETTVTPPGAAAKAPLAGAPLAGAPLSFKGTLVQDAQKNATDLMGVLAGLQSTLKQSIADTASLQKVAVSMGLGKVKPVPGLAEAIAKAQTEVNAVIENYNIPCPVISSSCGYIPQLAALTPTSPLNSFLLASNSALSASALVAGASDSLRVVIDGLAKTTYDFKAGAIAHLIIDPKKYDGGDLQQYYNECPQGQATAVGNNDRSWNCANGWSMVSIPLTESAKTYIGKVDADATDLGSAQLALDTLALRVRVSGSALYQGMQRS